MGWGKRRRLLQSLTYQHNITSVTENGVTTQYAYDDLNRLAGINRPNGEEITYEYDTRGNRTKLVEDNAVLNNLSSAAFGYNNWDELAQFTIGGNTHQYKYDPEGLRIKKESTAGTVRYHLDNNGRVIAESNAAGQIIAQNIWGHKALARKINGVYYYYIYNGHGDVVQILDEDGNVDQSYTYDEWGNILSQTGQNPDLASDPIRYAGEYYDEESGLYYLRARYYDPSIGRFISEDSEEGKVDNPLSLNLYTYCWNNPVRYTDTEGHSPKDTLNKAALYVQVYILTQLNKAANTLQRGIDKAKNFIGGKDNALDEGLGTFASQGGHHPMAKSAFEGVKGYDFKSALTISQSKLTEFGVKHSTITGQQKILYTSFSKTGKPLTMEAMKQIEIKALTNSGVPLDYAKNAVEKAIAKLIESGVTQPARIPWGK